MELYLFILCLYLELRIDRLQKRIKQLEERRSDNEPT